MKRRKFLIGAAGTAIGGSTLVGSGAFTSVQANRDVAVEVADDSDAFLALEDGDSDLVTYDDGVLEINLDGDGPLGEGVNMNAKTRIGHVDVDSTYDYPSDYEDNYAFKIRNQGTQTYDTLSLTYELNDTSWLDSNGYDTYPPETLCSYIRFVPYGLHHTTDHSNLIAPYPSDSDGDIFLGGVYEENDALATQYGDNELEPGESVYVSILVDTTGPEASIDDNLSGTLTISVTDPV